MTGISDEIKFKTARSGGKGGQNVNKVETMVEGYWHIDSSALFSVEQKNTLQQKLVNKINSDGYLLVKSQTERSQLGNKEQVIKKDESVGGQSTDKTKGKKSNEAFKRIERKKDRDKKESRFAQILQKKSKPRYLVNKMS